MQWNQEVSFAAVPISKDQSDEALGVFITPVQKYLTRRVLLKGAALTAANSFLSGCWLTKHPVSPCQIAPLSIQGKLLTIDAHCHVFNGSDLQVEDFFKRIVWNEKGVLGSVSAAVGAL